MNVISEDVKLGKDVRLSKFINLYGCASGDNTKIGAFVEVQKNAYSLLIFGGAKVWFKLLVFESCYSFSDRLSMGNTEIFCVSL